MIRLLNLVKKFLSIIICFTLLAAPVLAAETSEVQYDFSDEAQMKFNQSEDIYKPLNNTNTIDNTFQENLNNPQGHKFKRTKEKKHEEIEEVHLDAPAEIPQIQVPKYDPKAQQLQGRVVYVPQGTVVNIQLQSGISSGSLDENDRLTAILPENWVLQEHHGQHSKAYKQLP